MNKLHLANEIIKRLLLINILLIITAAAIGCRVEAPSDEVIKNQYLAKVKRPYKNQLEYLNAIPSVDAQTKEQFRKAADTIEYKYFKVKDGKVSVENGQSIYKAHVIANVKIDNLERYFNEWIVLERRDDKWVIK